MTEQTIKLCTKCFKILPIKDFSWRKDINNYRTYCKVCENKGYKTYYSKNKEKRNADSRARHKINKEKK